jgi:hyperosmotically inducible protein
VKGRSIDVNTTNGVVTLRGKVDSDLAHQAAIDLAKNTNGVTRVDDQLAVSTEADRMTARHSQPESKSPAWITTKIQAQYYVHPGLKPWNIDVTTNANGAVSLSGLVDNAQDRSEAVKIARETEGVTTVNDNLRVKSETAATTGSTTAGRVETDLSDSWITAKIQSRYFVDDAVSGRNINVDTNNGVVTLRGTVNSYSDGVREVRDQLTLAPAAHEPPNTSATRAGQTIEDGWITMKIQSKYFGDDQIKARNINVDTSKGVVTLNGSVPTDAARKAAEDLARETDGVVRVVNHLKVEPAR